MGKGNGVERNGFKGDAIHAKNEKAAGTVTGTEFDDQLKGDDGINLIDGMGGDDVLIAYAGADIVVGGTGRDDLSGGEGSDDLVGGTWTDIEGGEPGQVDAGEVMSDADRDTFVAGSTHEDGVFDTIFDYVDDEDGDLLTDNSGNASDVIDLTDAFVFAATDTLLEGSLTGDGLLDQAELEAALAGKIAYDATTGVLTLDGDHWFTVMQDDGTTADNLVLSLSVSLNDGAAMTVDYILDAV